MDAIQTQAKPQPPPGGRARVCARRNQSYKRNGTKSYVHLLSRFGISPSKPGPYTRITTLHQRGLANSNVPVGGRLQVVSRLVRSVGDDADGGQQTVDVTAEDQQNDSEYLYEVSIGTPSQKLLVDFDTSASGFWVLSTELDSALQQGHHSVFNSSKSSTFRKLENQTWRISYDDGSSLASGDCGNDDVTMGNLTLRNQTVELASELAGHFASSSSDGRLGLGFPAPNAVQDGDRTTPLDNIMTATKDTHLFTTAFFSERDGHDSGPESVYTFGHVDEDLVRASGQDIAWTDIDTSKGFWMFASASASVAGKNIQLDGDNKAIAATGTPLVLLSDEVCAALYEAIPGAKYDVGRQGYVFPLPAKTQDLPELRLAVGDKQFVLERENLAFAPPENDGDDDNWYGTVQSRGSSTFDILGRAFLKSVYAIWDPRNRRFGLVPRTEVSKTT